jgi:hypothetical protein
LALSAEAVVDKDRDQATGVLRLAWWLVLLVPVVIIIIALIVIQRGDGSEPGDVEQSVGLTLAGPTAEEAYRLAADLADEQWPNAELAIVTGQWTDVGNSPGAEPDWSFTFFSASVQHLIMVAVSGEEAWVVRDVLSPYQVPTFSRRDWRVDGDEAIQKWWDEIGRRVVEQRPDTDLLAQLRVSSDYHDQLVWLIAGLVSGQQDPPMIVVSGVDGVLVEQD